MTSEANIRFDPDSGAQSTLLLRGTIDVNCSSILCQRARQVLCEQDQDVVIDLQETEHLDTSAVQVLVALQNALQDERQLILVGASLALVDWLQFAGFAELLSVDAGAQTNDDSPAAEASDPVTGPQQTPVTEQASTEGEADENA